MNLLLLANAGQEGGFRDENQGAYLRWREIMADPGGTGRLVARMMEMPKLAMFSPRQAGDGDEVQGITSIRVVQDEVAEGEGQGLAHQHCLVHRGQDWLGIDGAADG